MKQLTILMGILLAGSYALAQGTGSSSDPYGGSSSSGSSTSGSGMSGSDTSSGSSTSGKSSASERSDSSSYKQHAKVTAEVIAADETSKTITVRPVAAGTSSSSSSSSMESVTLPVEGKALASLKSVKSGERVSLTCRNSSASTSSGTTGSSGTGSSYPGASSGSTGSSGSSTGSTGSSSGSSGSSSGMGSASGSMGSTSGSQLSAANCNSVTEISKVKATTSGSSAD